MSLDQTEEIVNLKKKVKLFLTYCLSSSPIFISTSVKCSDFSGSFLDHLKLSKNKQIRFQHFQDSHVNDWWPKLLPSHYDCQLLLQCRSTGRAASESRNECWCTAEWSPCVPVGSRPRPATLAPTQGRPRSRSQSRGRARPPPLGGTRRVFIF